MENQKFKLLLPKLDLQFFSDDFDIDAADQIIEQEMQEEELVDEELDSEIEDDSEVDADEESEIDESETPDLSDDDGRDKAFAALRRERDQLAADAQFIREFAEANGMTVEQLRQQQEEARLAKEAEAQGVPVDVIKRLSNLEQENEQVKAQAQAVRFGAQVETTLAKYNGTQADFDATIQYVKENGMADALRSGSITFEAAYKLANMDTMIDKAKRDAVQSDLASRKKRQQEAPIAAGAQTQAASTDELDAQVDADVKEALENWNF